MANELFNPSGYPSTRAAGTSAQLRLEFANIGLAFDKFPGLVGNQLKLLRVNATGTAYEAVSSLASLTLDSTLTVNNTALKVLADGTVGVGGAPTAGVRLTVGGTTGASTDGVLYMPNANTASQLRWVFNNASALLGIGADANGRMIFGTTAAAAGTAPNVLMSLDQTGKVGIGTIPGTRLEVVFPANPPTDNGAANNTLRVMTALAQAADVGGAISLGGSNTASTATRIGFAQIAGRKENGTSGDYLGYLQFCTLQGLGTMQERMRIDSAGNLLLGITSISTADSGFTANPAGNFQAAHPTGAASGSVYAYFLYNRGAIGSITQSGTAAVLYNTTSDRRLKTNIKPATDSGALVDAIQVRSFDWRAEGNEPVSHGFIAQELNEVFPGAVKTGDAGDEVADAWAVDPSKLVALLVAEVQDMRRRLAALGA